MNKIVGERRGNHSVRAGGGVVEVIEIGKVNVGREKRKCPLGLGMNGPRLFALRRYSNGLIHIRVCLLARFTVTLITTFKVLKITLKNSRANLAQAFLTGFVQCGLCLLLGSLVCMFAELLDGVKSAPVRPVLPLALSRHLLVQGINQEVVSPQDEREPCDPKNHEPLEHGAEPTASTNYIPAYYSFR